jgi:hypothetical protein
MTAQAQANKGADYHPHKDHHHYHHNYLLLEVGGFVSSAGEDQHINIEGLIGNEYTVDDGTDVKPLVGLGYFFNTIHKHRFDLDVGINAFYLFPAQVTGDVIQEGIFENLSYEYNIGNLPIYVEAKANIKDSSQKYALTLDLGIGPNIMFASDYRETSLDGGVTIPDDSFSNKTNVTFSATAGAGVKFYDAGGSPALELAYRFFYLGEGEFDNKSSQFEDNFKTGTVYANALVFSISI